MDASSSERFPCDSRTLGLAAGLVLLAGVLYYQTAARDLVVGDTPEFITVAATLGVPHAPGYPLFTMLGHLFSLLPFGSIPFRVNLSSAVFNALTVGMVYLISFRLTGERLAAAAGALLLAVSATFWQWSLAAEVFPLNNLLTSLLIFLLLSWQAQVERVGLLLAAFFVAGLGLTNQQTMVLLAPAFCFVLWTRRAFLLARPAILLLGPVVFFIGLLPYAYVPWASARHPIHNWGEVSSLRGLLSLMARRSYGSGHLVSTVDYLGGSGGQRILALLVSLGPLLGLMIVLGFIQAWRRHRSYFWFTLLAFTFTGPFFIYITNLNLKTAPSALFVLQKFFVLSHVVLAPLSALGIILAGQLISGTKLRAHAATTLVATLLLLGAGLTVLGNYHRHDLSHNHLARDFASDALHSAPPNSILFASGDSVVLPLMYLHDVEKMRSDTILIAASLLPADWYLLQLRRRYPDLVIPFDHYDGQVHGLKALVDANQARPIALIGFALASAQDLQADYRFQPCGLLHLVKPLGQAPTLRETASLNEQLLRDYHLPVPETVRRDTFEIELLALYAAPAWNVGRLYENAGRKTEALPWFQRTRAIDPYVP
ncbi:MAG TPA: DUF2723 domain-containing protein [Chthoniobacterales bacterium]